MRYSRSHAHQPSGHVAPAQSGRIIAADRAPSTHLRREQCVMRKNEERPVVGSSEDQLQRPLRHIDFCNLPPVVGVDENLAIGHIHVPARVHGHALASSLREGLQFREGPVRFHPRAVGNVLRLTADIHLLSWLCDDEPIRIEVVAESPTRRVICRTLLEHPSGGQKYAAILR